MSDEYYTARTCSRSAAAVSIAASTRQTDHIYVVFPTAVELIHLTPTELLLDAHGLCQQETSIIANGASAAALQCSTTKMHYTTAFENVSK